MKNTKIFLLVIVLLILLLVVKTNLIDGFTPSNETEERLLQEVEKDLKKGFVLSEKVIDISSLTTGEIELVEEPITEGYKVRIRQYFLHFFAYRERMLTY
mgnify:CR=1 FL=1